MHRSDRASIVLVAGALFVLSSCGNPLTEPDDGPHTWPLPPFDSLLVAQDWQPACSPDGRLIAYSHIAFEPESGSSGIYYVDVSADTVTVPELVVPTNDRYGAYWLSFAPDSRRVVYVWDRDLWVANVFTKETLRLTAHAKGQKPCWHPREDTIVYNRFLPPDDPVDSGAVRTINMATLDDRPVHTRSGRVLYGGGPTWDPAGRSIIYTRYVPETGGLEVFRVYPDSTEEIQLTDLGWVCELPKWFDDGRFLVVRISPGGLRDPDFPDWWVFAESGGDPRPFYDQANQIEVGANMAVGPGDQEFVLTRPSAVNEHWLALWVVKISDGGAIHWRQITGISGKMGLHAGALFLTGVPRAAPMPIPLQLPLDLPIGQASAARAPRPCAPEFLGLRRQDVTPSDSRGVNLLRRWRGLFSMTSHGGSMPLTIWGP